MSSNKSPFVHMFFINIARAIKLKHILQRITYILILQLIILGF